MSKKKISDMDLLRKTKGGDGWSKLQLWERYKPLVYKHCKDLYRDVKTDLDFEDLIQELYIAYERTLDYADLKKIPSETFSFGTLFFYFIRKKKYSIRKTVFQRHKEEQSLSYDDLFEETGDEVINYRANPTAAFYFNEVSHFFSKNEFPDFYKELSPLETSILDLMIQDRKIVDISKEMKKPYSKVYREVCAIREKAEYYFKDYRSVK